MKPKKKYFFLYTMLFVYLVSVCGLTINKHFCGGELESVTLIKQGSCCEGEESGIADDCCANETIYLSNKTETLKSSFKLSFDRQFSDSVIRYTSETLLSVLFPESFNKRFFKEKPPFLKVDLASLMVLRI